MTKKKKKSLKARRRRRARKAFFISLFVLALAAAAVRFIVFVPVYMPTDAMQPTYRKGDLVYADKLEMWKNYRVNRGDMVYARFKANDGSYIRRVEGMPGDLIDVRDDGKYLVVRENGLPISETALGDAPALVYGEIPSGAYLLLADDLSVTAADGRTLGLTYETEIIASPGAVLWPLSRAFRGN